MLYICQYIIRQDFNYELELVIQTSQFYSMMD